jgi:hypothetical protein
VIRLWGILNITLKLLKLRRTFVRKEEYQSLAGHKPITFTPMKIKRRTTMLKTTQTLKTLLYSYLLLMIIIVSFLLIRV